MNRRTREADAPGMFSRLGTGAGIPGLGMAAALAAGVLFVGGGMPTVVAAGGADEPRAPAGSTPEAGKLGEVLNERSFWDCFMVLKTEEVRKTSGELEPMRFGWDKLYKEEMRRSEPPPADWTKPDFDDTSWFRARGPFDKFDNMGAREKEWWPRNVALLSLRGKFEVKDPGQVGDLKLELAFRGGVVVYLNGKEVARAHLPQGEITPDTPAEDYPKEAYLCPDGTVLREAFDGKFADRFAKRVRRISDVKVPTSLLKKGINVLAVEIHRAPTDEVLFTARCNESRVRFGFWSLLSVESLKLSAPGEGALVPGTARPKGLQVWNASPLHKVRADDYAPPGEKLRPILLVGARNGAFSGQVVIGSTDPIRGLKAAVTALRGDHGGELPASAIEIRYGKLDGPGGPGYFDGLEECAPAEVPVSKENAGAVQPVWVTVNVPKDAKPGKYAGKLTLSGPTAIEVPIEISIAEWALPAPKEFASFLDLVQSPETLAEHYKAPMWSEKHWKLVDRSFDLMGRVGSKVVYIPLIRRTHFGNPHTMVRWIRQKDGSWQHDFSIAEKYLDTAVRRLGQVPVVCLSVWNAEAGSEYFGGAEKGTIGSKGGIPFTVLDPATGNLEEAVGPKWGEPEVREFWKPVVDGIREILKKRGLEKSLMVGWATDMRPNKATVEDLKAVAPDAEWVVQCHPYTTSIHGVPVGYLAHVWGIANTPYPSAGRAYGWKNPRIQAVFPRYGSSIVGPGMWTSSPLPVYRVVMEAAVTSPDKGDGLRGVGRLGADFWPVGGKGQPNIYPCPGDNGVSLTYSAYYLLSRGSEGALSSARFEMMREGIQEVEARIFIEKALTDPVEKVRLGADLARRSQEVLDERTVALVCARAGIQDDSTPGWMWFAGSGWQKRSENLYAVAAEVAGKPGGK
ncbi:MAG: glycoside hydrolase domain-containing protein [Planctomycetota bacterium]